MDAYARRQAQSWGGSLELLAYMLSEKRDVWIWDFGSHSTVGSSGALPLLNCQLGKQRTGSAFATRAALTTIGSS